MHEASSLLPARLSIIDFGQARPGVPLHETAAEAFLARYSGRTLESYASDLKLFFRWCTAAGVDPLELTRTQIELFLRWMESPRAVPATRNKPARPYSRSSIARRYGVICLYFKYAVIDEHLLRDPTVHVKRPRLDDEVHGTCLTRPQMQDLLAAAENGKRPEDHALVCLLGLNGLRISEALGLDICDIGRIRGYVTVDVRRKGGKTQQLPMSPTTSWAVERAMAGRQVGPVLRGEWGERMSKSGARDALHRLAAGAGIVTNVTPHTLRRTFITLSLDADVSLRDVQHSAGHADPRTTSRYDRMRNNLARNATHKLSAHLAGVA